MNSKTIIPKIARRNPATKLDIVITMNNIVKSKFIGGMNDNPILKSELYLTRYIVYVILFKMNSDLKPNLLKINTSNKKENIGNGLITSVASSTAKAMENNLLRAIYVIPSACSFL
jgi:hypothetical protein